MDAIRVGNPQLHALLVSSAAPSAAAAAAFGVPSIDAGIGGGSGGGGSVAEVLATPVGEAETLVTEEAAALADGIGTALDWFKQVA